MKKQLLLFAMMLLPMVANAHDIEVQNGDGVTIYYKYTNDGKELEVTFRGTYYDSYSGEYTGIVVIPEEVTYMNRTRKVTSIGELVFRDCSGLTSVTIPNSVTSIGQSAFYRCSGLTSVTIPNSVTSIGNEAFSKCTGLISITIGNSVTCIGQTAFGGCSGLTSITIPNSVTSIGNYAFSGCSGLTSITIGNSVTSIGNGTFKECSGLTSVTIPNSVTSIGNEAFSKCTGLISITIGNSVTSIGEWAFYYCPALTTITIPNSVTSIGTYAFYNCSGLTTAIIGNGVKSIGGQAFWNCSGLTSVTIGNSVTSIGGSAFYKCTSLTSVTIPNSVTSIGEGAFEYCDIATVISLIENPLTINGKTSDRRAFSLNTYNNATLYVPKGTIDKYKATNGWKDFVFIEESGTTPTPPTPQTCEKPTISYQNGKLTYTCATEGAECVTNISDADIKTHYGNEISLTATYIISVYATKEGYENSETATATLCWIDATPQTKGIDGVARIAARPVLVKTDNGFVTVEGIDDQTDVWVYTTDGKLAGTAVSHNNTATVATSIPSGSIAIVKVADRSVKMIMK